MLLVGGLECFAAGWVYKIEGQIEKLNAGIVFAYMFTTFGSVVLACGLWFGLNNNHPGMNYLCVLDKTEVPDTHSHFLIDLTSPL